ncbi:PaaX family transcriptional regulator C-terminal domain-containing protein [Arthrobacter sp. Rue61a]|uniref:PaaX family transcriptional regulator n=1 Tax=Arthrobacter sp. Rue61a TaxID=1118963 RepID=UPI000150AE54|nr:PaaX family transcriptional regulator C-terminal domain-containing protein [Arthrobacter sp. Rue61a]AFR34533.1 putative transcriptional regulator [Arthrobacter sp. Rue61a]
MPDSANDLAPMPRHQHLIVTVYGLYSRTHDGGFAVSDLIRLLGDLGVESAGVRSSVSRLKKRGVLSSFRQGGVAAYKLAQGLEDVFRAGDERIFARRRAKKGDDWILVSFSVPEAHRHLRHKLRTILTRIGCGQVSPGLWIAPGNLSDEVSQQLDRAGLMEYVDLFKAAPLTDDQIRAKVGQWWDLASLEALYNEFIERYEAVLERWLTVDVTTDQSIQEKLAFSDYVPMVTQWRRLPYLDPGLPSEYLPEGWSGLAAETLFAELHAALAPMAEKYASSVVGGSWADD